MRCWGGWALLKVKTDSRNKAECLACRLLEKTMNTRVSIAIPVYNEYKTIARCIESALENLDDETEILIHDNHSTDGTSELCKKYAEKYKEVKYLRQETNIGPSENFKSLLSRSSSEYITFLGADDWLEPGFVPAAKKFLDSNPDYTHITSPCCYYDETGNFQFTTGTSSIESSNPTQRVLDYIELLTDNSEFYGVFRRSKYNPTNHPVIGCDWIWMFDQVETGKLKSFNEFRIHRTNRWGNPGRHLEIAEREGIPISQATDPHYATYLYYLAERSTRELNERQTDAEQSIKTAWRAFTQYKKTQPHKAQTDFANDLSKFIGEPAGRLITRFYRKFVRLCHEWTEESRALSLTDLLEISITTKLKNQTLVNSRELEQIQQAASLIANEKARYIANILILQNHENRNFLGLNTIPDSTRPLYIDHLLEASTIFKNQEDYDNYHDHLVNVLNHTIEELSLGAECSPMRLPTAKQRHLDQILNKLNLIPVYFSNRNVKHLMERRDRIARAWLTQSGVTVDYKAEIKDRSEKKIRVALLAQSLNSPTDTYTSLPAICGLSKNLFDVIIISLSPQPQKLSETEIYSANIADRVICLTGGTLKERVEFIRSLNIDILLIGNNTTAVSTELFKITTCKLARRHIAFNPACVTTGQKSTDYYISGTLNDTPDGQSHYSEKLIRIDGLAHARLPTKLDKTPPRRDEARDKGIIFVSGANHYKITPTTRHTWIKLLKLVGGSTLILYPFGPAWSREYDRAGLVTQLFADADAERVDRDRIKFHDSFPRREEILDFLGGCTIYLDSMPFSGVNSLIDPLIAGIAPVTCNGDAFRSTLGSSVLLSLDLGCLVANSVDEYISIAYDLAVNTAKRHAIESLISQRVSSSQIFDIVRYSRKFEKIFLSGAESDVEKRASA